MAKFPIPSSPVKKVLDIDNFNGVDFTSKVPDISRSNNALNVIKRNGFHQIRKAFEQYITSKPTQTVEQIGEGSNISGAELLICPTSNPEQMTNEEFKKKYPNFEEGKVVIGNELGPMFIERNNPYQYGLFYVVPTTYGGNDMDCIGYEISKNLLNSDEPNFICDHTTWIGEGESHTFSNTTSLGGCVGWFIPVKAGETYTFSYKQRNSEALYLYIKEMSAMTLDNTFLLRKIVSDATGTKYSFIIENDCYLAIYFNNSQAVSNIPIENIQLEEGSVATEYTPYVHDDGIVTVGNIVATLTPFTLDQWAEPITIFDKDYEGYFYKVTGAISEERVPKLVDKIIGELWEETSDGYHKVSDEHEMYLKISSRSIFGGAGIEDYFQVFENASLLGYSSKELKFYTEDIDRENKPLEYYKKVMFNDKPHYFTTTGIRTVKAKQIKKLDGTITIDIECDVIGSYKYPAKTPLYQINCDPELTKFTQNEDVNLINHMVEVGYKGDAVSKRYKLLYNTHSYLDNEEIRVRIMQNDGSWIEYGEHDGVFSRETSGDYIVFVNAPGKPPVDGEDNVIIKQRYGDLNLKQFTFDRKLDFEQTALSANQVILENTNDLIGRIDYAKDPYMIADGKIIRQNDSVENPYPNGKAWYWETVDDSHKKIYKYRNTNVCPSQTLVFDEQFSGELTEEEYTITRNVKNMIIYGNENEKRLFINGDKNIQVYSDANDITYWPSSNYNVIGDESDIVGFGLSNGYLLTFKKGNNSIFVQQGATVNNKSVFPIVYSQDANNVLSEPIQLDDRLYVFTTDGLQEIAYSSNLLIFTNRSYFIDKKLKEMNFDTLKWFKWDDNLYFMLKDKVSAETHIFVADLDDNSRVYEKASSVGNSFSTGIDYQYEWYYLKTNLAPILLTEYSWNEFNNTYLLGYNNDGLFRIRTDENSELKLDTEIILNGTVPILYTHSIKSYWETPFIDMDDITKAKTIRGVYLNTNSKQGDKMVVIVKTIDDGYNNIGTVVYDSMMNDDFPRRIYIKDKVRKFMNVKYLFTNNEHYYEPWKKEPANFSFNRLSIEYQEAGKYRGE